DGSKAGAEFLVNTTTASFQETPVVAQLANGGWVIAWGDDSQSGGDTSGEAIRAQVFNADGSRLGGEIQVNTTTLGIQSGSSWNRVGDF
ncbi:MAG TPA: hypothetical protein VGI40_08785, partial [Pirellulaceae bacterium]